MKIFSPAEFEGIWRVQQENITGNCNANCGQKCKVTGKATVFMLITVLKHGGQWDPLGRVFGNKDPKFKHMITRFAT